MAGADDVSPSGKIKKKKNLMGFDIHPHLVRLRVKQTSEALISERLQ